MLLNFNSCILFIYTCFICFLCSEASSSGSGGSSIYNYYDFSTGIDSTTFPVCANVTLTAGNPRTPDIKKTIYDCINNTGDAQQPPRYGI